jgi:hypothetical protein
MSVKVVINRCYGGFGLSEKAEKMLQGNSYNVLAAQAYYRQLFIHDLDWYAQKFGIQLPT